MSDRHIWKDFWKWVAAWWEQLRQYANVLRPTWFASLVSFIVLIAVQTPQAVDILSGIGEEGILHRANYGLFASLLLFATCCWYFPRAVLYVEYSFTPDAQIDQDPPRYEWLRKWWPRGLGLAPILSVALVFARLGAWSPALWYLITAALFFLFVVWRRKLAIVRYLNRSSTIFLHPELPTATRYGLVALMAIIFALFIVSLSSRVAAPQLIGPFGVLLSAASGWVGFATIVLTYPTLKFRLPSLIVIAFLLAGIFSLWNDNHQVRLLSEQPRDDPRLAISQHYESWLQHRSPVIEERERPYPVFIVSAEGGGIRAAYWTAAVLNELQRANPNFACHVFAISGVSGGSLGAAAFVARVADLVRQENFACDRQRSAATDLGRYELDFLGQDFLSPALAGMVYPDLVQRFLPAPALPDRASYLERAWEDEWSIHTLAETDWFAEDFLNLWDDSLRDIVPSLFLNGTWVEDGGRVVTSNLRQTSSSESEPPFVRLYDLLGSFTTPFSLATAVHMSARFTYVSPAGSVRIGNEVRHIVDGGYFENSGALTASEIYQALDACAQPDSGDLCSSVQLMTLVISNNPDSENNPNGRSGSTDRSYYVRGDGECRRVSADGARVPESSGVDTNGLIFGETLRPLLTLFSTRTARGYHAEDLLAATSRPNSIRFQLQQSDRLNIPLGWVLSAITRIEIECQAENIPAKARVTQALASSP